jgi:hypothetical protein
LIVVILLDETSKTCAEGGGNYCGIYRSLKKMEEENKKEGRKWKYQ